MLWTTSNHTLSWPPPTIVSVTFLTEPRPRSTSILDRPGTFCYANNIPQLKTLPSVNAISVFTKRLYVHKENILMTYFPSNLSVKGREWIASMMQPPRGKLFLFTCFIFLKLGGMFQENSIETCMLSRVKQITSPGWMHETSTRTWCTGKTQRDRVEREVGGGIGMGNTCKPMAVSFQCMTKSTTIKIIIIIK